MLSDVCNAKRIPPLSDFLFKDMPLHGQKHTSLLLISGVQLTDRKHSFIPACQLLTNPCRADFQFIHTISTGMSEGV